MTDLHQHADGHNNKQAGRDINETTVSLSADGVQEILARRPSIVAKVIAALAEVIEQTDPELRAPIDPYDIQEKIDFNHVVEYRELFNRYSGFGSVIDAVCDELDVNEPGIKRKLFEYVAHSYVVEKGRYEKARESIAEHSDEIITKVRNQLLELAHSDDITHDVSHEDIELSVTALVTKAFIDCKLLEHPPKTK